MLHKSPFATGIDGYFYAGQVKFYLLDGQFKIPESSPILFILVIISNFFSDIITANKFSASLFSALLIIPAFLIGKQITKSSFWGILTSFLFSISSSIGYMTLEFTKNLGAIFFLLFFIYFLLRYYEGHKTLLTITGLIFFGLTALLAHRTTTILSIYLFISLIILPRLIKFKRKRLFIWILSIAILSFTGMFIFISISPGSGLLHYFDILRFKGAFHLGFNFPGMSSVYKQMLPASLHIELSLIFILIYIFILFIPKLELPGKAFSVVLIILFNPLWNMNELGMGFRMLLLGSSLFPILILFIFAKWFQTTELKLSTKIGSVKSLISLSILLTVIFVYQFTIGLALYDPKKDPPYAFYKEVISRFSLSKDSLLVCHKGLNLFYTYCTGKDGLNFIPEYHVAKEKLWRLSYWVDFDKFEKYIPEKVKGGLVRKLDFPYHLIREDSWNLFMKRIPDYLKESYRNEFNPYKTRPRFLKIHQKNKKTD